jgi:hypothetical protein
MQAQARHRVLPEADGYASDASFTVDHSTAFVPAGGNAISGISILYDHNGVGSHPGCLFAQFFFD